MSVILTFDTLILFIVRYDFLVRTETQSKSTIFQIKNPFGSLFFTKTTIFIIHNVQLEYGNPFLKKNILISNLDSSYFEIETVFFYHTNTFVIFHLQISLCKSILIIK